jgi:DHA1 family bicyclomycin/chloramphenicol resistance-like MFS transporter
LSPQDLNRAQLILTSFVAGIGVGTFFVGPISDSFGRKPVIIAGSFLYIGASAVAYFSTSLEVVLAARVVQGLGASAPRIVSLAIMRDFYSGRIMARMMSIAMIIFTIFPAFAPLMGAGIIALAGWRSIFLTFILFSLICVLWMSLRLPESLPKQDRRAFRLSLLFAAALEMVRHPTVRLSILVQCLSMGMLFTMLTMVQPVFDIVYGRGDDFPFWFAAVAVIAGSANILNAALVVRVGMRRMVTWSLGIQVLLSGAMVLAGAMAPSGVPAFGLFVFWQMTLFFVAGTTLGNLSAMAMEPMGHIAGMAASVVGGISTVVAAAIAAPVGLLFDGSTKPLALAVLVLAASGWSVMIHLSRIETRLAV